MENYEHYEALAAEVVKQAVESYKNALIYLKQNKAKYDRLIPIVKEHENWKYRNDNLLRLLEKEISLIKRFGKGQKLDEVDIENITIFLKMEKPKHRLSKSDKKFVDNYYKALMEKINCETYFRSKVFNIHVRDTEFNGEKVIVMIQKEVNYA